jgi:hypothetical protein
MSDFDELGRVADKREIQIEISIYSGVLEVKLNYFCLKKEQARRIGHYAGQMPKN